MSLIDQFNAILPETVRRQGARLGLVVEPSFGADDRHNKLYWVFLENQPDFIVATAREHYPEMPPGCNNVLSHIKELDMTNIYFQW